MSTAIEIHEVHKHFGLLHALRGISFSIAEGEFFALLGPNGAGKSTLINILGGLIRADQGAVRIMGHDVVTDYRSARRAVGIVPQELVYDPFFTVREALTIQSGYFGITRNQPWIDELMHQLGLTDKADVNMRKLSGGMKRRVLVALALVHKPAVIVLDEPTAGVDVELRISLWAFIKKLNQEGHTIVLTTHYLQEAEQLCQRVAMLKDGRLLALDSTENLVGRFKLKQVRIKLESGVLPVALAPQLISEDAQGYVLELEDYTGLEKVLGSLREAGSTIQELELAEPDLEDVFVSLMRG